MTRRLELAVVLAVAVADQLTKWLVVAELELYQTVPVVPGLLNLTHIRNSGVAFGFFNAADFAYKPLVVVGSSRVDLQACKLEYSIVSPK